MTNAKKILFILLLFVSYIKVNADEVNLGQLYVTDTKINNYETLQTPQFFATIINVADNPTIQSQSLSEVLSSTTQLFIKDTGSDSSISTVSIRGSSAKNVLVMIDNIPVNDSLSSSFNLNMIPASIIDKIEITRGGASSIFGSSAMGGVINIITKSAKDSRIQYFSSNKNFRANNTGYNFTYKNDKINLFFALNNKIDLGNYLYKDDNGTFFNKSDDFITRMNHNKSEKSDFLIKNLFYINKTTIGYIINYTNKKNYVNGPTTFASQYANATLQSQLFNSQLFVDFTKTNKYVTGKAAISYKNDAYIYQNEAPDLFEKEYSSQTTHNFTYDGQINLLFIPFNFIQVSNCIKYDYLDKKASDLMFSLTISDEISPLDNLTITPVTRLEFYNKSKQPVTFLWNIALTYEPIYNFKIKLNGFKSFRKPNFTEMYYKQGLYIGNQDLQPETSYGGDIGFIYNNKYFFLETVAFCTYFNNLISYILSSGFVYRPVNVGQVLSFGLECNLNVHIIKYFTIECSYTLNFVNSITDLQNNTFIQQNGHPRNSFFTKLSVDIFDYHFGVQIKVEDEINITYGGKTIPCKGMLDAFLRIDFPIKKYKIKPTLYINANNLLNLYTCDERNYPLEGRNFEVGIILYQIFNN